MGKRGQIAIVLVIAVVLVMIAGAGMYFMGLEPGKAVSPDWADPVRDYVDQCLKGAAEDATKLAIAQGGHVVLPEEHIALPETPVAYGMIDGKSVLPSRREIEIGISEFVRLGLTLCDLKQFEPQGFTIELHPPTVISTITKTHVLIEATYPLIISKQGIKTTLEDFRVEIPAPLYPGHSIAQQILVTVAQDPDWIDLNTLGSFPLEVGLIPHSTTEQIYTVTTPQGNLAFVFGVQNEENDAPVITAEDSYTLTAGTPFSKTLQVSDDDTATCKDNTALFDISADCKISFTPKLPGTYETTITAEDQHNNFDTKVIIFEVR